MIRVLSLVVVLLASRAWALDSEIQGYVLGVSGDRVSVDLGTAQGIKPGDIGILKRDGLHIASLEVVRVDRVNAFLRIIDGTKGLVPHEGESIFFTVSAGKPPEAGAGLGLDDSFVPLLAPLPAVKKKAVAAISTRTHGRVRAWHFVQNVAPLGARYTVSRFDSDGSVDRIVGTSWSFLWAGNATYRDGNRTSTAVDFRRVKPRAHRLTLARPLGEKGFIRMGRFFPNELPGLGTVDGAALQLPASWLKVGVVAGARPDRRYQDFASQELVASAYASAEAGSPGRGSYAATLGTMHTRWLGKADELALLLDQRFDLGPLLGVYQSAQFDFDTGTAAVHKGTRLTRFDLSLNSTPAEWLSLRGGGSHFEPIDVAAERALAGVDPALYIDNGYWRYWAGTGQTLPWGLGLDEEISWMNVAGRFQPGLWRATLSRQGLPWMPNARVYASGYNVGGAEGADHGASAGLSAPFFDNKLALDANAGFRYDRGDGTRRRWKAGDASVRLGWRPNRTWDLDASATRVWQSGIHSTSVSGGVSYRW